jgi:hypothetical protein
MGVFSIGICPPCTHALHLAIVDQTPAVRKLLISAF